MVGMFSILKYRIQSHIQRGPGKDNQYSALPMPEQQLQATSDSLLLNSLQK
jgi:hypothetical protein